MRTTINLNEELLSEAAALTGIEEKTKLISLGLEALISRESAKRTSRVEEHAPR
jgi:Arc/MetJ family transcription regulator